MKGDEMDEACSTQGEIIAYKVVVGKSEGKGPLCNLGVGGKMILE
jgi:hypothetical protein